MSFDIDVRWSIGGRDFHVAFQGGSGLTAVTGASGSGKTSLLNIVAGLLKPDRGHVAVAGERLFDSTRRIDVSARARCAGYVFQDARLFPHMRVLDNLVYGRRARARAGGGLDMTLDDAIGFLDIGHLIGRWPATLSGGEAQRVAIGRALLSGPRFLLMDEPLGALDAALREDVIDVIERLRDGLALPILYVSHDSMEVERLADRILWLSEAAGAK